MAPNDADVLYALTYLNTYGYTDSLDELYDETFELGVVSKTGKKPKKENGIDLSKHDRAIAEDAIKLGQKLLSEDSKSTVGLNWARLGHHLDPTDHKGLYTLRVLLRGMTIKPAKTSVTSTALAKDLIERAQYYVKKAEKDKLAAHLAQLYFKVVDSINPNKKEVLIGLMRLEQMEFKSSLDDLLEEELASLVNAGNNNGK